MQPRRDPLYPPPHGQLCRVFGWGPVELSKDDDKSQIPGNYSRQMPAVKDFTVFIKNNIFFPQFHRRFGNTGKRAGGVAT